MVGYCRAALVKRFRPSPLNGRQRGLSARRKAKDGSPSRPGAPRLGRQDVIRAAIWTDDYQAAGLLLSEADGIEGDILGDDDAARSTNQVFPFIRPERGEALRRTDDAGSPRYRMDYL